MSKCQKNKYFIGSSSSSRSNKDFNNSFSKLMAARDAQDSRIQAPVSTSTSTSTLVVRNAESNKSDIDIILSGDF